MNPKYPANLDPKLREAYERVMGTNGTSPAPASAAPQSPPPPPESEKNEQPRMVTEPMPKHEENDNHGTVVHFGADTEKHKKEERKADTNAFSQTSDKNSTVTTVLLGAIGVLFFIGYALFWAQIFGFKVIPSL
jgi:hypothetical protein